MERMPDEPEVEQPKEQKLNRQQRRIVERANDEANRMHARLVNQFAEFFIDNDPSSDAVIDKQADINAKWRMYCKNRNLLPEVFSLVDQSCNKFREQYLSERNETGGNP